PPLDPADPHALVEQLQAHLREHPEDDAARLDLAHVQWLHLGDAEAARSVLDRLAEAGDPVARLSRLVMAEAREEPEVIATLGFAAVHDAAKTAPDDRSRRLHVAAAELAARLLGDHHGDRPHDDREAAARIDALPATALPFRVSQPLSSLRAAIARRQGEPYQGYYEAQGCVQAWAAGPVQGSRGAAELLHA